MLRRVQCSALCVGNAFHIAGKYSCAIQNQAGEHPTVENSSFVWLYPIVTALIPYKPIDLPVVHAPDNVLLNLISPINRELRAKIVAYAAGSHFYDQFRRAFNIALFIELYLPPEFRLNNQMCIWLGLIVGIEPNRSVIAAFNAGSFVPIHAH